MTSSCDFLDLHDLLTPAEREVRQIVRQFVEADVVPHIASYWENGQDARPFLHRLRTLNICGAGLTGYGIPAFSRVSAGLISMELARGDASLATLFGATSSLCMTSIALCGSEAQKQHWLPKLASLQLTGTFALTEPEFGSDAAHIQTSARREGESYVLNGTKRWIGAATFADVVVVWARAEETGQVCGFLVEQRTPGYTATAIEHKLALRAIPNADIVLQDCRIPLANKLEQANSFQDTARVLRETRLMVAWIAAGVAQAVYELALQYAQTRTQFGKPIASFQLVQHKLVNMLQELELMKLATWRLAKLQDAGTLTDAQASFAKRNNAAKMRDCCALAREILGGNGILIDRHVARFFADAEAIYSYEGTHEINTLILGRAITGLRAFV
ncbi:MAG: acyl-CoA dehydrogenase [Anaerolineae bacterium]|nr:acyl-CoA dehydrogenase [Anaerolineae bacterium]